MPLYAQNREAFVDDRLRAKVFSTVLYDLQPKAGPADRLVMGAVDHGAVSAQVIQPGIFFNGGGMVLVAVIIFVKVCGGKVLYDGAPQPDIDELHTLADAEDRFFTVYAQIEGLKL